MVDCHMTATQLLFEALGFGFTHVIYHVKVSNIIDMRSTNWYVLTSFCICVILLWILDLYTLMMGYTCNYSQFKLTDYFQFNQSS